MLHCSRLLPPRSGNVLHLLVQSKALQWKQIVPLLTSKTVSMLAFVFPVKLASDQMIFKTQPQQTKFLNVLVSNITIGGANAKSHLGTDQLREENVVVLLGGRYVDTDAMDSALKARVAKSSPIQQCLQADQIKAPMEPSLLSLKPLIVFARRCHDPSEHHRGARRIAIAIFCSHP